MARNREKGGPVHARVHIPARADHWMKFKWVAHEWNRARSFRSARAYYKLLASLARESRVGDRTRFKRSRPTGRKSAPAIFRISPRPTILTFRFVLPVHRENGPFGFSLCLTWILVWIIFFNGISLGFVRFEDRKMSFVEKIESSTK